MVSQDAMQHAQKSPPDENIYENVARPSSGGGELSMEGALSSPDEPPPPPQPPYGPEEPRVRLERDRERRSIRKLTKDSGYETSQYAESDYANLDWDSEQASEAAASDRSPTSKSTRSPSDWSGISDPEGSTHSSGIYIERYRSPTEPWRSGQLYWQPQQQIHRGKPSHRSSSNPSRHGDSWDYSPWSSRSRVYSSSEDKATSPPSYNSLSYGYSHHRRNSSSNSNSRIGDNSRDSRPLGRYSSTDSLTSGSSSVFSYPLTSVSSAKSTPSLSRDAELDPRRPPAPLPGPCSPTTISSSRSTPNLEHEVGTGGEAMVTRRFKKNSVYEALNNKSGLDFSPLVQGHPYWEDHESREEYEAQVRLAASAAFQAQHMRQISSQSSGSEWTSSSSYSQSQHSRQVSSQSSLSEEDFRIQSIKEEFFHRTNNQDFYPTTRYGRGCKDDSSSLHPYASHKYYSSDNLISSYIDEKDLDMRKMPQFIWAKSQPDLKGIVIGEGRLSNAVSPPIPPIRDASSLKYSTRYVSGHEKYPSWPITNQYGDEMDFLDEAEKQERSNYGRSKKYGPSFTQYLKPVIENPCDKKRMTSTEVPPPVYSPSNSEKIHHRNNYSFNDYYSEQNNYYVSEYSRERNEYSENEIPLPPERDVSLSKVDEIIAANEEKPPPYSPPKGNRDPSSEETQCFCANSRSRVDRSPENVAQQTPYPHETSARDKEPEHGVKTMTPSSDPDSGTPLMDSLRREIPQQCVWVTEEGSSGNSPLTGRESVTSSNSSQETLKWHGSTSDVSVVSERTRTGYSVESIVHSARVQPPQRHHSMSVLYYSNDQQNKQSDTYSEMNCKLNNEQDNCMLNSAVNPNNNNSNINNNNNNNTLNNKINRSPETKDSNVSWNHKGQKTTATSQNWADQVQKNNFLNSSVSRRIADDRRTESLAREEFRSLPTPEYAKPLSVAKRVQDLERQARSNAIGANATIRSRGSSDKKNDKDDAASPAFLKGKVEKNAKSGAGGASEDSSPDKALYLDPEKKHRVSDPELKAIQKQAVLSFFERQTANSNNHHHQQMNGSDTMTARRPHSLPRDYYQEFKNHSQMYSNEESNTKKPFSRLDRVLEVDNKSPTYGKDPLVPRSSKVHRPQRLELQTINNDLQESPVSPQRLLFNNGGSFRQQGPRNLDNTQVASRVAIYYNTYTQTLPWPDENPGSHPTGNGSPTQSPPESPSKSPSNTVHPLSVRERHITAVANGNHHPRKNVSLQTECSVPVNIPKGPISAIIRETKNPEQQEGQQTKRISPPVTNAECEQQEDKENKNSISNQFVRRLSSSSIKAQNVDQFSSNNNNKHSKHINIINNNKNSINAGFKPLPVSILDASTPPERPPKRPHLRPRSSSPPPVTSPSPPPLLPRARPNNSLHAPHMNNITTLLPPPPPPSLRPMPPANNDENNVEDSELKSIEDSAKELRRLNGIETAMLAEALRIPPPPLEPPSRTPSPELPLPPPPRTDEMEVTLSDEPLPPPPTLTEVHQMGGEDEELKTRPPISPPLVYHKNSYMSYKNGRYLGRHGFDGNYNRKPSLNSETTEEEKQNMEPVTTSLTPKAWERWHNIGRTGSTVVFTSQDLKSGSLKPFSTGGVRQYNVPSYKSSESSCTESNNADLKSTESKQIKLSNEENGRKVAESSYTPAYKSYASFSQPRDVLAQKFLTITRNNEESSLTNGKPLQRRGTKNGWWASLESLAPQQCKSINQNVTSWPPNRRVSIDQSSLKLSDCETQTPVTSASEIQNGSRVTSESSSQMSNDDQHKTAKSLFRDHRKNSSTQTALEQLHHVEVMTQTTPSIVKNGRFKRKEELECEQLTKDLVSQLPEEDKALQAILFPKSQLKTTADYLEGLFEMEPSRTTPSKRTCSVGVGEKQETSPLSSDEIKKSPEAAPLPADSAYFTTSESKAKFLTRYSKDVNKPLILDAKDTAELGKKKEELINSISRKLEILRSEQLAIQEEILGNQELGKTVTARVENAAKPNEFDKYKQHIEETEKITSLLLSLSGRLARAENALMNPCDNVNQEERKILEAKRDKLFEQHEEAKKLKENIDKRSQRVSDFLNKYLTSEEYADYDHFIKMKSKLLIDSREIDEKIKLGEEQMLSLKDSLAKKP